MNSIVYVGMDVHKESYTVRVNAYENIQRNKDML